MYREDIDMATTQVQVSPDTAAAARSSERTPDPCIVVIFGASGDLTKRKLLPALYHLEQGGCCRRTSPLSALRGGRWSRALLRT